MQLPAAARAQRPVVACRPRMTDARVLLERHTPAPGLRLAGGVLRRLGGDLDRLADQHAARAATGRSLATPPKLSLGFLGPHTYADAHEGPRRRRDRRHHPHLRQATPRPLHPQPRATATASTATPARDSQGRLWLQYWLFYYYNDYQLLGPLSAAASTRATGSSCSSGSTPTSSPSRSSSPSTRRPRARRGATAPKAGDTPLVYVARGSHANYFAPGLALDRQLVRPGRRQGPADRARARSCSTTAARLGAVAGLLGRHQARHPAAGLLEPDQPGPAPALAGPVQARRRRPKQARRPARAAPQAGRTHRRAPRRAPTTRRRRRPRWPSRCAPRAPTSPPSPTRSRSTRPRARSSSPPTTATTTSGRASSAPTASPPRAPRPREAGSAGVAHARRDPGDRGQQRRARLLAAGAQRGAAARPAGARAGRSTGCGARAGAAARASRPAAAPGR